MIDLEYRVICRKVGAANFEAKKQGVEGRLTVAELTDLLESHSGNCDLCGEVMTGIVSIDHIVPFSHPDCLNVIENIQLVHRECNSIKHTKPNNLAKFLCRNKDSFRHCFDCKYVLPIDHFAKPKGHHRQRICRGCYRRYMRNYYRLRRRSTPDVSVSHPD